MSEPKQSQQLLMPLVLLPSGVSIRADKIVFIARKELNQYVCFMENTPASPNISGQDLDVLKALGVVQAPEGSDQAAQDESKIATT